MNFVLVNLLTLNSPKTEFLLIGLSKQLAKINNSSLTTTHSARNLGFIFDEHLTFSEKISSVSKSCYYHIRQLSCIRPYPDTKTASTIATSVVHSKLDNCNSLYHNLPKSQITRLQQIQNSLAGAVVNKSSLIQSHHSHLLVSALVKGNWAHWIQAPLSYLPPNLHICITSSQFTSRSTRSSSLVTLTHPSTSSSLRITDRSFQYASPRLFTVQCAWYQAACNPRSSHGCQCSTVLYFLLCVVKLQLTICCRSSKPIQIVLCLLMSLSIHLHGLHLNTQYGETWCLWREDRSSAYVVNQVSK